jgi:hypothetical protein
VRQTLVQDGNTVRLGSGMLEVGDDVGTLVNLGLMNDVNFEETFDRAKVMTDNGGEVDLGIRNHKAGVQGNLVEINLSNLNLIRGGIDNYETVAAAPVAVTNEAIVLNGTNFVRLANKNGDKTEVTAITVTNVAGTTTYVRNTDYVMAVDSQGYTCIARIAGGTITDKSTVHVDYTHTPAAAKKLTSGGKFTIAPKVVRITNTNDAGKIFRITVYKATNEAGIKFEFPGDEDVELMTVPINLVGVVDTVREAGDQLFEIYDEQSA